MSRFSCSASIRATTSMCSSSPDPRSLLPNNESTWNTPAENAPSWISPSVVLFELVIRACPAVASTRVPIGRFTWTTAVGVMPLTALTALLGQRLQEPRFDDPVLWAVLGGVIVLLALARPLGRRLRASQ